VEIRAIRGCKNAVMSCRILAVENPLATIADSDEGQLMVQLSIGFIYALLGGISFVAVLSMGWWGSPDWLSTIFNPVFLLYGCFPAFFVALIGKHFVESIHWSLPCLYSLAYWLFAGALAFEALAKFDLGECIFFLSAVMLTFSALGGHATTQWMQRTSGTISKIKAGVIGTCIMAASIILLYSVGERTTFHCSMQLLQPENAQRELIQELERQRIPYKVDRAGWLSYRKKDEKIVDALVKELSPSVGALMDK
jgi:hypothetical protein